MGTGDVMRVTGERRSIHLSVFRFKFSLASPNTKPCRLPRRAAAGLPHSKWQYCLGPGGARPKRRRLIALLLGGLRTLFSSQQALRLTIATQCFLSSRGARFGRFQVSRFGRIANGDRISPGDLNFWLRRFGLNRDWRSDGLRRCYVGYGATHWVEPSYWLVSAGGVRTLGQSWVMFRNGRA